MPLSTSASREAVRNFLKNQIGVGGTFTMLELRNAVPGANQIDRRMRELRQCDPAWIIHSSQSDPSLPQDTYRVDVIGGDKLARRPSSRTRRQVFEAANHCCQVCGIGVGEEYAEYPGEKARLQLGHWVPLEQGGSPTKASNLRAECHRCNGGIRNLTGSVPTAASVEARAKALSRSRRKQLVRWMDQGRRDVDDIEIVYHDMRSLPVEAQTEILNELRRFI